MLFLALCAAVKADSPVLSEADKSAIRVDSRGSQADKTLERVQRAIGQMPRPIKEQLWAKGVHVVICRSVADYQKFHHGQPYLNTKGWTWDNLKGYTDGDKVLVGETYLSGKPIDNQEALLYYELGHAYDVNVCHWRTKPQMHEAYNIDSAALTNDKYRAPEKEIVASLFSVYLCQKAEIPAVEPEVVAHYTHLWSLMLDDLRSP